MPNPWSVLLVEDDEALAETIESWLRQTSHGPMSYLHATTLRDALARLNGVAVDVILLDLNLPDSQQLNTLTAIVQRYPHIAVVVMTGLAAEDLMIRAVDAGAEDFIAKSEVEGRHLWERLRMAYVRHARQRALFDKLADVTKKLQTQEGAV